MAAAADLSIPERVRQLLQHLGIRRAHVAGAMREVVDLAERYPDLIASVTLVGPFQPIEAEKLRPFADRLLLIHGDRGPSASTVPRVLSQLPGARDVVLREYFDAVWSDPAATRGDEVSAAILAFLRGAADVDGADPLSSNETEGEVAGITYRVQGAGPPLVLFPLILAASQWEPLHAVLATQYRTVTLGGAYMGSVAHLAQRARAGYGVAMRELVETAAPQPGERILDVGCGSGEVTRWIARRTGGAESIVGVDVNPYLLREAASLARAEGVASQITFQGGNAEALPFPSGSFDVTVSCTVMEEVNADQMLAEMIRVTRPGGRVAVMVRATDMGPWVNLPLPPELRAKVERAGGAGLAEGGCADASLYRRFLASGLTELKMGPKLGTSHAGPGFADARRLFEPGQRAVLSAEEQEAWDVAVAQADAEGTFMVAQPLHCAVGTKP